MDGPLTNRNSKITNSTIPQPVQQNSKVPVSKSGVIVVDTEKLIQQSTSVGNKKKKKKNKKAESKENGQPMITLKNPIFHTLQSSVTNKLPDIPVIDPCEQQASIIKNENGMVTIRSPRLQQTLANGTAIPNLLTELKPVIGPNVSAPYLQTCHASFSDDNRISSLNAQEILSGLPGIEITKVDKRNVRTENDNRKSCQAADVSIIPTNNSDKFNFDKDDWHYGKNMMQVFCITDNFYV